MPVEVSFHPETFEEFFLPVDAKHPGLSEVLKSEFLRYIESRRQLIPSIFGRDVPYTQPPLAFQACLMHIHICIPPALFPKTFLSMTESARWEGRVMTQHSSTSRASCMKIAI